MIASRPKENLALVFYDFDQNIGTIDFPKLKRDTRFVKKEQRWTKRLVESVIKNDLKIKSKEEMEKRLERASKANRMGEGGRGRGWGEASPILCPKRQMDKYYILTFHTLLRFCPSGQIYGRA